MSPPQPFSVRVCGLLFNRTYSLHIGLREYAISPILVRTLPWPQYERRKRELGLATEPNGIRNADASSTPQFWADRRTHNLLDSGLSGAATGGIIRGWKCTFHVHRIHLEIFISNRLDSWLGRYSSGSSDCRNYLRVVAICGERSRNREAEIYITAGPKPYISHPTAGRPIVAADIRN